MTALRIIPLAISIAVFTLTGPPAGADKPEGVVEAFYRAVDAGRLDEALTYVRSEDREILEARFDDLRATVQDQFGRLERVEAEQVALDDDEAEVLARVRWETDVEQTNPHTLVRRDGRWLLKMELPPPPDTVADDLPEPDGPPVPLHLVNRQAINPYNVIHVPRPNPGVANVPLRTSFFVMVGTEDEADHVDPDSVAIAVQPKGGDAVPILERGQQFAEGYSGELFYSEDGRYGRALAIHVESTVPLEPETEYDIIVEAESFRGERLPEDEQTWSFTTESAPTTHDIAYTLDLAQGPDVLWNGEFFNSLAKPAFCTSSPHRLPHYDLIAEAQAEYPHAWNLQRDAYLAGFEHQPDPLKNFPNIVRERETRRIISMTREDDEVLLHVEDFFGHEQYGIESDRPLTEDYHAGNEILIADGENSARAFVVSADDTERVVRVTDFDDPAEGWKLDYVRPLPDSENPHAPGLFPPGGTYLRMFDPVGTPHYYWGRVDQEWDIVHGEYGRGVIPRFASAIGCLAIDGQSGTTAKDLAQHHEVTRRITSYLIERYGDATLDWPWVILNEPDLMALYWRNRDWEELQRFYDYTSDAILRAFEDHGYDSHDVQVGGLELGAIWGDRHLRLDDFLYHCSPNVDSEDAVTLNAAYADPRLDGKRSERVERLCGKHDGMGAPLDFLSVHSYNASDIAAAKLIRSKERALEIDPDYYETLPIVSHETVPTWRPIVDPGAGGMYLGNGYYTSWMADYQGRLLRQGAKDERYAYGGDLILMHWPGIVRNFVILNDTVRQIRLADRSEVIPKPSFHFVNLLSTLRDAFWVFPLDEIDGHAVSGFAARTDNDLRVAVYAHHHEDTASESEAEFAITLTLEGVEWGVLDVKEYRFDRDHNSHYRLARQHRAESPNQRAHVFSEEAFAEIEEQARLRVTSASEHMVNADGQAAIPLAVSANGANIVILRPVE